MNTEFFMLLSDLTGRVTTFITGLMIASGACCHYLSSRHGVTKKSWGANSWFWAGFFGTIPVVVTLAGHIVISRLESPGSAEKDE